MTTFDDPYGDPATGILRNLANATTREELAAAEADLTSARFNQLQGRYAIKPTGDLAELRGIHLHLFQDVYDWAGKVRTVDLAKGGVGFVPTGLLQAAAANTFNELAEDGWLQGMGRERFVDRLTHHVDQVNHLHPFREGNGRTQRVFWSRVATDAGWHLDWSTVEGARNDEACRIASANYDTGPLRDLLDDITSPAAGADQAAKWNLVREAVPESAKGAVRRPPPGVLEDRPPIRGSVADQLRERGTER